MAKEYCSLAWRCHWGGAQPLKLVKYHFEKEKSLYSAVFEIPGYLFLSCYCSSIALSQGVVIVL